MSRTGSRSPRELRDLVRGRDGDDCSVCELPIDFTIPAGEWMGPSLEHLVPLAAGGTNDPENLRLAHARPCNQAKGSAHDGVDHGAGPGPGYVGARRQRKVTAARLTAAAETRKAARRATASR